MRTGSRSAGNPLAALRSSYIRSNSLVPDAVAPPLLPRSPGRFPLHAASFAGIIGAIISPSKPPRRSGLPEPLRRDSPARKKPVALRPDPFPPSPCVAPAASSIRPVAKAAWDILRAENAAPSENHLSNADRLALAFFAGNAAAVRNPLAAAGRMPRSLPPPLRHVLHHFSQQRARGTARVPGGSIFVPGQFLNQD